MADRSKVEPGPLHNISEKGTKRSSKTEAQREVVRASFHEDQDIVEVEVDVDSQEFGSEREDFQQSSAKDDGSQKVQTPHKIRGQLSSRSQGSESEVDDQDEEDLDQHSSGDGYDSEYNYPSMKFKRRSVEDWLDKLANSMISIQKCMLKKGLFNDSDEEADESSHSSLVHPTGTMLNLIYVTQVKHHSRLTLWSMYKYANQTQCIRITGKGGNRAWGKMVQKQQYTIMPLSVSVWTIII